MLADYARNLDDQTRRALATRWRAAGWTGALESFAGRPAREGLVMATLASALARTCKGRVLLMEAAALFGLPTGAWTPDEIDAAQPRF